MERSEVGADRPASGSWPDRGRATAARADEDGDERSLPLSLLLLLAGEVAAFAALAASGNMPEIVSVLYRALLTL